LSDVAEDSAEEEAATAKPSRAGMKRTRAAKEAGVVRLAVDEVFVCCCCMHNRTWWLQG